MKRLMKRIAHLAFLLGLIGLPASLVAGDTTSTTRHATHHARSHVQESAGAQQHISHMQHSRRAAHVSTVALTTRSTRRGHLQRASLTVRRHRSYERFTGSSFTDIDLTNGDAIGGEDPVVRQAAMDALGNMN